MIEVHRAWINQPSTRQPFHALHGVKVLAVRETEKTARAYFLDGPVISQQIAWAALSPGWPV